MRFLYLCVTISLVCSVLNCASAMPGSQTSPLDKAIETARTGNYKQAIVYATQALKAEPKNLDALRVRAQIYSLSAEHPKAIADYSAVLKQVPQDAGALQRRGEAYFRIGKITESLKDFDAYLAITPEQKPHHWQRGISLYYAGRFADGKAQFELHQTVNSNDVENAVWHFLCTARAEGLEAAKKQLIPIEGDSRIPMAQVHQLFAGKITTEDVLKAAQEAPKTTRAGEPLFYAHLYLGLYYEAIGDSKKAKELMQKAATRAKQNGYMGDVAWVHAERLKKGAPKPKK